MESKKKKRKVITFDGTEEYAVDCKLINKIYYKRGDVGIKNSGQVYFVGAEGTGKWYRINTNYLFFDYTFNQYKLRAEAGNIVTGIVDIQGDNTTLGEFSTNALEIGDYPKVRRGGIGHTRCIDENLLTNSRFFKEDLSTGVYSHISLIPAYLTTLPQYCSNEYKMSLNYNAVNSLSEAVKLYEDRYVEKVNKRIEADAVILKDLTFGLEFESTVGTVPIRICKKLGLIPLRDGSINGIEYATIPLTGAKGVKTLVDSLGELGKRTAYDDNCSLHIHYGNLPRTEGFILALFKVLYLVQEEMYDMFPFYKFKNCKVKRKHYTKSLPAAVMFNLDRSIPQSKVKENFRRLYNFFSMGAGEPFSDLKNVDSHPVDPSGEHKWNIKTRYHWVNFIPLIFGNKETVEFRIHTATYDTTKVLNFLYICGSILNFVKDNEKNILLQNGGIAHINLSNILFKTNSKVPTTLREELLYYIERRKRWKITSVYKKNYLMPEDTFLYHPSTSTKGYSLSTTTPEWTGSNAKKPGPSNYYGLGGEVTDTIAASTEKNYKNNYPPPADIRAMLAGKPVVAKLDKGLEDSYSWDIELSKFRGARQSTATEIDLSFSNNNLSQYIEKYEKDTPKNREKI